MAYYAGFACCVVLAVASVLFLGPIGGAIFGFVVAGGTVALLKRISRRYYDPMAPYQAERRITRPR